MTLSLTTIFIVCSIWGSSLGVSVIPESSRCQVKKADILFILDSTENVGPDNHKLMVQFLVKLLDRMERKNEDIYLAAAQFAPEERFEFNLEALADRTEQLILNLPYTPCRSRCENPPASINSIVNTALSPDGGNRIPVPDILVVLSTSLYQIPELNPGELLTKPHSVTHAFIITVGKTAPKLPEAKLQFAATTSYLAAINFQSLPELAYPLCQSIASYLNDKKGAAPGMVPVSLFVLMLVLLIVTALIFFLVLAYAVYRYRNENKKLKSQLSKERQNFKNVDEYYRSKLREKSATEKDREKAMLELINESNKVRDHYREQTLHQQQELDQQTQRANRAERDKEDEKRRNDYNHMNHQQPPQQPQYLPILGVPLGLGSQLSNLGQHVQNPGEAVRGDGHNSKNEAVPRRETTVQVPPLSSSGDYEREPLDEITNESNNFNFDRTTSYLPVDHPARALPPVDVLLLIDSSSSIGNNQFENVKLFLKDFVNDIDISPGRSKVSVVLFAHEPQVFFGFDRFYSNKSVQSAIEKMPYLGGPTFLAKALSFAAGILYQDQNMKSGRYRKHKFMPTPRHDRLQVMIVVSDGASDDNFDKQATHLHEKMLVKIAAVVTKSFNKDRLLPITRFDGSVFLMDQQQALSIWLWRQQRMWTENFAGYVEREKSLTNMMESSRQQQSTRNSPKKKKRTRKTGST